jgi:hypothetical protein
MYNISITIADILIEVKSPISASELKIEKRLGPFFQTPDNPIARVSLLWEENADLNSPRAELVYDPGSIWRMYHENGNYYATISYPGDSSAASPQAVLRARSTWDALALTEHRNGATWKSLLNIGAGELILRTKILFADGLVFHAGGIDDNGRGIVLAGHSGAGKSTQVQLWGSVSGVIGMNDDRIAVRADANGAWCYGTPWGGTAGIARNHKAPLSTIFLIEQALENDMQKLHPSVSAPMLLARAFLPYWDRFLMQRAMANMDKILSSTPVYLLRCRPEMEVISLVRSVL